MAEPLLATRAPENDAEDVDVQAQSSSSTALSDHCVTDRPTSIGSTPSGDITKINGIDVYISKPNDYPHRPAKLLLFLTGGTGLPSRNNQLQADKYANEGFVVVMPDMFDGDQAPNASTTVEEMNLTVIEQVKLRAAAVAKSFFLDMWLARHTAAKIMPILYKVLEGAQEEFADAVAHGNGVYGVGYCLGAKYCLLLAGEGHDPYSKGQRAQDEEALPVAHGPYLKAGAIAHGTLVTMEDFEKLKSPMLLICVEDDQLFPQEVLEQAQEHMEEHNVSHQVKVIPGVPHGFAVVGEYEDPAIKAAQAEAFQDMVSWLSSH